MDALNTYSRLTGAAVFMRDAVAPARWMYNHALTANKTRVAAQLAGTHGEASMLDHLQNFCAFRNLKIFLGLQHVFNEVSRPQSRAH